MDDTFVTVGKFSHVAEAQLAQSKLASEGIESFIRNENTISINWLYSNAMGGVQLQVFARDAYRARTVLAEISDALDDEDTE